MGLVLRLPAGSAPGHRGQAAVGSEQRAHGQAQLAPPHHVGEIAERAHHHQTGALVGVDQWVREHRRARAEQGRERLAPDECAMAIVVGVRQQRHACRDELGARRIDQRLAAISSEAEADPMHRTLPLAVLELGLRHGGAEVHVPQRRRLELIGLPARQQAQE